jgi:hypothetical protein
MSRGRCKPAIFETCGGAPLDALWAEFFEESGRVSQALAPPAAPAAARSSP